MFCVAFEHQKPRGLLLLQPMWDEQRRETSSEMIHHFVNYCSTRKNFYLSEAMEFFEGFICLERTRNFNVFWLILWFYFTFNAEWDWDKKYSFFLLFKTLLSLKLEQRTICAPNVSVTIAIPIRVQKAVAKLCKVHATLYQLIISRRPQKPKLNIRLRGCFQHAK